MKKLQSSHHVAQTRRKTPRLAPLVALTVLLTLIPLYYPSIRESSKKLHSFEPLDDPIRPSTDVGFVTEENTVTNNANDPCSGGKAASRQCSENGGQGGTKEEEFVVEKKREKRRRRKKARRPRNDHVNVVVAPKHSTPPPQRNENRGMVVRSEVLDHEKCDLFSGEWVPNPEGPYYTNATCDAIQEHQNCMKFGRPDTEFLKWRWNPDDCELPVFDPSKFLELVEGKSIAFVGDSVARNHMQSLICLLSRVAYPVDLSNPTDQNKRYEYREYDFKVSMFWAPYLVKTGKLSSGSSTKDPFSLYLDEFDENWTSKVALFDYVIVSAGHWFFRPTYFYLNNRLVGCLYCPDSSISHLTSFFSYRRAFRTALRAINGAVGFKGVTFVRTFAPSHFEGGPWDKGGSCARTRPFKRNETSLRDFSLEMYLIQLEELRIAQKAGRGNGGKRFRLFDATKPMVLRPDGHPSKYGHWPVVNQTMANDCVHWCLPGPIDTWNDFLQELLKREIGEDRLDASHEI